MCLVNLMADVCAYSCTRMELGASGFTDMSITQHPSVIKYPHERGYFLFLPLFSCPPPFVFATARSPLEGLFQYLDPISFTPGEFFWQWFFSKKIENFNFIEVSRKTFCKTISLEHVDGSARRSAWRISRGGCFAEKLLVQFHWFQLVELKLWKLQFTKT